MNNLIRRVVPMGWMDVVARVVMTELAGVTALVLKEWIEAHEWDPMQCATDAAWVAGAMLVLNVVLMIVVPRKKLTLESAR